MLVHPSEARRRFRELAEGDIANAELAHAALVVALEDYPRLDCDHYLALLDDLAARVEKRCVPDEPAIFRLGHLHAEMFDVDGYTGDSSHYYDPRNAYLNEVIDRKVGLPITLSIAFIHVATRLGLNVAGVGLPGHYLVKVRFDINEVFVDPFHGGETLTLKDIAALLRQVSGGAIQLTSDHLRAWSGRETIARVLGNLVNIWTQAGDARKANAARERMALLQ